VFSGSAVTVSTAYPPPHPRRQPQTGFGKALV
jgi:hypothetical protein